MVIKSEYILILSGCTFLRNYISEGNLRKNDKKLPLYIQGFVLRNIYNILEYEYLISGIMIIKKVIQLGGVIHGNSV